MMRCPKCGARFTDDNAFCLDDGTTLVGESGSADTVILPTATPTFKPAGLSKNTDSTGSDQKGPLMYILIGAMAATIAALAVGLYLTNDKDAQSNTNVAPPPKSVATNSGGTPPPARIINTVGYTAARTHNRIGSQEHPRSLANDPERPPFRGVCGFVCSDVCWIQGHARR